MKETVLIIDDEEELRSLLTTLLKLEGYQVFQAASGREGMLIAEKEEPAVIISDVRLPDISGLSLLPRLKEQNPPENSGANRRQQNPRRRIAGHRHYHPLPQTATVWDCWLIHRLSS